MNYGLAGLLILGALASGVQSLKFCQTSFRVEARAPRQQQQQFGQQQLGGGQFGGGQFGGPQQQEPVIEWIETETASPTSAFTITTWIYHQTTGCERDFLRIGVQAGAEEHDIDHQEGDDPPEDAFSFLLRFGAQGVSVSVDEQFGAATSQVFVPIPSASGELDSGWHNLAAAYDGASGCGLLYIYIDGVLIGTRKLPLQHSNQIQKGSLSVVVNGEVCDVSLQFTDVNMYSRVLAPAEVTELASCGPESAQIRPDLVSYLESNFVREPQTVSRPRALKVKRPVGLSAACCPPTAP